jgi:predicted transglutaminase-like cysteine proteinase
MMNLYTGNNWEVVFVNWCQEFPGQCIVSCTKEKLSDLTSDDWIELGQIEKELERITKKYLMQQCIILHV